MFKKLILLAASCAISVVASAQHPLEISRLTENFYIYTTYSDYKGTLFPSNGMYVVTNRGVILIDTPWDPSQFQTLLDSIAKKHLTTVVLSVSTHSHADRTAGLEYYSSKQIQTYTSKMTDSISIVKGEKRALHHFTKDTTFHIGEVVFETFYPGAGHTLDNQVIWFPQQKVLYGGCLIKSTEAEGLGNISEADLNAWPSTLEKIKRRYGKPRNVIPGHQSWENNTSIDYTLQLLKTAGWH